MTAVKSAACIIRGQREMCDFGTRAAHTETERKKAPSSVKIAEN